MAGRRPRRRAEKRFAAQVEAQAELDFHGLGPLTDGDVSRRTRAFVEEARREGLERVRIVVGQGRHSAGEPRVGPWVRRTLARLEREGRVRQFHDERVDRGGAGAVFVRLGP